jgi:hypothetical protein
MNYGLIEFIFVWKKEERPQLLFLIHLSNHLIIWSQKIL